MIPWGVYLGLDSAEQSENQPENVFNPPNPSPIPPTMPDECEKTFITLTNLVEPPIEQSSGIAQQFIPDPSVTAYGQVSYGHTPLITSTVSYPTNLSNLDYMPQYFTTTLPVSSSLSIPSSSTLLINSPPISTSSVMQITSDSNTNRIRSQPINSPKTVSLVSAHQTRNIKTSIPTRTKHKTWKKELPPTTTTADLLVSQPLHPQENIHIQIIPKVTATTSHERSTLLPGDTASIKQEHEKDERIHRVPKHDQEGSKMVSSIAESIREEKENIMDEKMEEDKDSDLEKGLEDSDLEKGLECLVNLINLRHSSDEKPEESAIVTCTSQRIRHLRVKNALDEAKTRRLKQNIQRLSDKIASLQASLPLSPRKPTVSQKAEMEQFLERYVKERTSQDYDFWIMAKMMQSLMVTLIERISQLPSDRALAETSNWLQTNFRLSIVRANASSLLMHLATNAGMLNDPNGLQEYIKKELSQQ